MALNYDQLWGYLKAGKNLRLVVHRSYVHSVKRMISKKKDVDKLYKLLIASKPRLSYVVEEHPTDPMKVILTVVLRHHATNKQAILED